VNNEEADQASENKSTRLKLWESISRLYLIVLVTIPFGLLICIPLSLFLQGRANQAQRDAMYGAWSESLGEGLVKKTPPSEVIHILNYQCIPPGIYANDFRSLPELKRTNDQIDQKSIMSLDDAEALQNQQKKLLRELIKKHNVKKVYVEWLTEENQRRTMNFIRDLKIVEQMKKNRSTPESEFDRILAAQERLDLLELGAAGQIVVSGELEAIVPADNSKTIDSTNLIQADDKIVFNWTPKETRAIAIAKNLLHGRGVVVTLLGGNHDLSEKLEQQSTGVKYTRIAVPQYVEIME
jgi:hypothetical protein